MRRLIRVGIRSREVLDREMEMFERLRRET